MKKLITVLCLLCGFAGTALYAQNEDEKITEIIELSNVTKSFDQLPALWTKQADNIELDADTKTKFKNMLNHVFDVDSLKASYFRSYKKRYISAKGDSLLVWFHSPLAQKFREAQLETQSEESQQLMVEFFSNCDLDDTTDVRLNLCYRMERSLDGGTQVLMVAVSSMKSFMAAINPFLPETEKISEEQMSAIIKNYSDQMKDTFKKVIVASYLFTYRNMPTDEFESFIEFYESDLGIWQTQTAMAAITDVFKEAAVKMAIEIKLMTPEEKSDDLFDY